MTDKKNSDLIPPAAFGSCALRLTGKQWIATSVIVIALATFVPGQWYRFEKFDPGPDYRVPYEFSQDYALYDRWCRIAVDRGQIVLIGDSVIWGEYVDRDETLSHALGELAESVDIANGGLNGMHPASLAGLVDYYTGAIRNQSVIIHLNPLWMSSKRHDLQITTPFSFNHARLAPQFYPRIPCYAAPASERIGNLIGNRIPFFGWVDHLRTADLESMDFHQWTLDHPYEFGIGRLRPSIPESKAGRRHSDEDWRERGVKPQSFEWVDLGKSFQWRSFRRMIEILRRRGNRVFVIAGPFNEHLLEAESRRRYAMIKGEIETWLGQSGVSYFIAPLLPTELYADASHPLAEGYTLLAQKILDESSFKDWLMDRE